MRRGQNLVLFSLFLVLLCVAVLATIGVTHQARRKLELNTTADAAAYSQAVATARTFNSIALLNRAQAATMVALAGAQSAVSFVATYRGLIDAARAGYHLQWQEEYCGSHACQGVDLKIRYCQPALVSSAPFNILDVRDREGLVGLYSCSKSRMWSSAGPYCPGDYLADSRELTCKGSSCPVAKEIRDRDLGLYREMGRVLPQWKKLDQAAGLEVLAIQGEAFHLGHLQQDALTQLNSTAFAQVLQPSGARLEHQLSVPEVARAVAPGSPLDSAKVSMGSRRHQFITQRLDATRALQLALDAAMQDTAANGELVVGLVKGNSYFSTPLSHGGQVSEFAAWGDEHGTLSVNYRGPAADRGNLGKASLVDFGAWVRSTDRQDVADSHVHCPVDYDVDDNVTFDPSPKEEHTLRPHQDVPKDTCPNSSCIWPDLLDINPAALTDVNDAFGQPKAQVTAGLPVDPRAPWNLHFRFGFSHAGATIDLRDDRAVGQVSPLPQMVSTAMAYYHRPGHWKEPPNLFNPFWRATLVRADVDDAPLNDVQTGLRPSAPWASEAVRKLLASGYRGIP